MFYEWVFKNIYCVTNNWLYPYTCIYIANVGYSLHELLNSIAILILQELLTMTSISFDI